MDIIKGRAAGRTGSDTPPHKKSSPLVSWTAITLGVFITGFGVLLLFWGLSWQGSLEESDILEPDRIAGGPVLLPLGVFCIALGVIWVLNGYRGFSRGAPPTRRCPHCSKPLEPNLAFCYHCGEEISEEGPLPSTVRRR